MQDLHDSNLLHRDIKPANIMLTSKRGEEKAYLTDFGIARDAADTLGLTATTQAVLTLAYAAPERLSLPSGQLDRRVDVFSLGCVFYEMLTGRRAFPGGDSRQILHQIMDEYPPPRVAARAGPARRPSIRRSTGRSRRTARTGSAAASISRTHWSRRSATRRRSRGRSRR